MLEPRSAGLVVVTAVHGWPTECLQADGRNGASGQTLAASTYVWSTPLRVFILYANPVAASFGATLHRQVVTTLRSRGHEIDDCDLYAETFDPVMGEQERM